MAYVSVPKDLTKVKNKVAFNLTKRQIICFAAAAAVGLPFYFLTRDLIGNSNAVMGMVVLMVPAFLFAMYERDGMPLEKVLMNMITVKFRRPHLRLYETVIEMTISAGSAELERRNAQAGIYAAAQRGGRNRARQG